MSQSFTIGNAKYDVAAIGNALVDILADTSDSFLAEHNIAKGGMTLIDAERAEFLYGKIGPATEMSGGSAGNTIAGIASLSGKGAYMGKVRDDQFGKVYRHDMKAQGVDFVTPATTTGDPTGQSLILITPDAERSMNTFLGAAVNFEKADIDEATIAAARVTYLEGYLFDRPAAKDAFRHAARVCREAKRRMALTLSDTFCVQRHREDFLDLVRNGVDILFANEAELLALFSTDDLEKAIAHVRDCCTISVTTRSEKGAIIISGATTLNTNAAKATKVVDTTGAGDLYAAGFLFGLTHGRTLNQSADIGAIAAAEVISHYGPRPQKKLFELL